MDLKYGGCSVHLALYELQVKVTNSMAHSTVLKLQPFLDLEVASTEEYSALGTAKVSASL